MVNPGTALTNSAITTDGSIGQVTVTGNQLNSEIKTGFDYPSYLAGLQGTRSASRIGRLRQRGDLVNSVDSATFVPAKNATTGQYVYSYTDRDGRAGLDHRADHRGVGHGDLRRLVLQARVPGPGIQHRRPDRAGELRRRLLRPHQSREPAAAEPESGRPRRSSGRCRRACFRVRAVLGRRGRLVLVRRAGRGRLTTARGRCPSSGPSRSRR